MSPEATAATFSFKEQSNFDYFLKRDPMQEFFTLSCQAIKLNSPHMNTICTIDTMSLYKKAIKMSIPFFKWANWIENHLNKEFLRIALRNARNRGLADKPVNRTFIKAENLTKQKVLEQARFFQEEMEQHNRKKQGVTAFQKE